MKYVTNKKTFRTLEWFFYAVICVFLVLGCSENKSVGDKVSIDTGAISFNVVWPGSGDGNETSGAAPRALTENVCQDFGVTTVIAKIYSTSDVLNKQSPNWPCSDREGTISGVSPGQMYVIIEGYVESVDASPEWLGQSATILVVAGQTNTDLQTSPVVMAHTSDETAPTIIAASPEVDASNCAINTAVAVEFSEALAPTTIDGVSFSIENSEGNPVAGTVVYNADSHIALFDPTADFAPNATYTVTILGGAETGVVDMAGNPLDATASWDFTTSDSADSVPPTVTNHAPVGDSVGIGASIQVAFSEPMNPDSISDQTFLVNDGTSNIVGSISYQADNEVWTHVATFDPESDLELATVYSVTIVSGDSGVKDLAGNPLGADYTWSFTTATQQLPNLIWDEGNWDQTNWN